MLCGWLVGEPPPGRYSGRVPLRNLTEKTLDLPLPGEDFKFTRQVVCGNRTREGIRLKVAFDHPRQKTACESLVPRVGPIAFGRASRRSQPDSHAHATSCPTAAMIRTQRHRGSGPAHASGGARYSAAICRDASFKASCTKSHVWPSSAMSKTIRCTRVDPPWIIPSPANLA